MKATVIGKGIGMRGNARVGGGVAVLMVLLGTWGCSTASEETDTVVSALSEAESDLTGTEDSLDNSRAQAKVCFDAFRSCLAAEGADRDACRSQLKSCLPDDVPMPRRCGPHPGRPPKDGDGGLPPPPPREGEGAGAEVAPQHLGGGGREGAGKGRGDKCGKPPVPRERIERCKAEASNAGETANADAPESAHKACVGRAYGEELDRLCARAGALCANAIDADVQAVCARVQAACANPAATSVAATN
jgi:hypothetical protein